MSASYVPRFLAATALISASFGVGVASASAERVVPAPSAHRPMTHVAWPKSFSTDSTGLYTMEQAARGEEVFIGVCYECHEVEDLTNEDFQFEWEGRSVWELYELVRTTMPDENPGTLSREQYLDAIAYVLKINNQPAGPAEFMGDSVTSSAVMLRLSQSKDSAPAVDSGAAAPDTAAVVDSLAIPDSMAVTDSVVGIDTTMTPPDTGRVRGFVQARGASAAVRGLFR